MKQMPLLRKFSSLPFLLLAQHGAHSRFKGTLYLDNNHFSGTIPSELVQLLHLGTFHFARDMIGLLDSCIVVESLFLDRNRFVGQIPSSFSMSPRLAKLRLNDNSLTGSIPSHIGQLRVLGKFPFSRRPVPCP